MPHINKCSGSIEVFCIYYKENENVEQKVNQNEQFLWNDGLYRGNPWKETILLGGVDEQERDLMYMREMYPLQVRKAQDAVEQRLDQIDNSRCFIYDEYPDKYLLRRLIGEIKEEYYAMEEYSKDTDETLLENIITILLLNEIYRRRRKKWW